MKKIRIDRKAFNKYLLEWATNFKFKINGDYIIPKNSMKEEVVLFTREEIQKFEEEIQKIHQNLEENGEAPHRYQRYQKLRLKKNKTFNLSNIEILLNKKLKANDRVKAIAQFWKRDKKRPDP
jgi:hypothetical protein